MPSIQVVGVTHCRIIMLDDIDNKKELKILRTEPLLHLSGTQLLKYGDVHHYYCVLQSLNTLNRKYITIFL